MRQASSLALLLATLAGLAGLAAAPSHAGVLDGTPSCIAPAKPGGGFDLSCRLAQQALRDAGVSKQELRLAYLPGGIGAVAFNTIVTQRPADAGTIVAFSSGTLLNLAQGRFGRHTERDVRWLATIGIDHGVIAVRRDSPLTSLRQLVAALKANPNAIVFGGAGTIGSQDWMKAALLARAAGVGHKAMRFVAFEGGGDAMAALAGGHVQVLTGDAAEVGQQIGQGAPIRVLALLAERRLPGAWSGVPTALEQGLDIRWPIVRGFYVGPQVGTADVAEWTDALSRAMSTPRFGAERARAGLQAHWASGDELQQLVARSMAEYRALVAEFGLGRP